MRYPDYIMMYRTQLSLDSELHRRARRRASELGISLSEYVRRLLARDLGEPAESGDVSVVFGLGQSGGSDIRREKDARVAEAFDAERRRGRE